MHVFLSFDKTQPSWKLRREFLEEKATVSVAVETLVNNEKESRDKMAKDLRRI